MRAYTNHIGAISLGATIVAAALAGCEGSEALRAPGRPELDGSVPQDANAAVDANAVERGRALYGEAGRNCIQCHRDAATLRRDALDTSLLADRTSTAITSNTGRMGDPEYGFGNLTRQDLLDIAAYIFSLAPNAPGPDAGPSPEAGPPPPTTAVQCVSTGASAFRTEVFASGLTSPWGMAFLPDNSVLVTQKAGSVVRVSANGTSRTPIAWGTPAPQIVSDGQGGLLDIAIDPNFESTPWVYFTYSEPGPNNTLGTAVGRASLQGNTLANFQRIYQQTPKLDSSNIHFGARLAFRSDQTLFVSLGDRSYDNPSAPNVNYAQSLANTIGKIIRIDRDGTVPANNPFQGQAGVRPEIWSLGHRNPQGLTFDAMTATLWSTEHGPQGGDEIDRILPSVNYGWPLRSYGCPYGAPQGTACRVGGGVHQPANGRTFNEPLTFWAPTSIAPSNILVYRGTGFPAWNGQLFMAALVSNSVWRITVDNGVYVSCESLPLGQRVRDVRQGPDGWIWLLTDSGEIRRMLR